MDRRPLFSQSVIKAKFARGPNNAPQADLDSNKARSTKATSDCTKHQISDHTECAAYVVLNAVYALNMKTLQADQSYSFEVTLPA